MKRNYNHVCWSDEVIFYIGEDGNMYYVICVSGKDKEWLEKNLNPSFKSRRTSVGVWSCYCGDEMGPLVIIKKGGTMTAERYLETVKKHFIPFIRRMKRKYGNGVVMQEDNASWHKAKLVTSYLDRQKIKRIRWPPQSPDLSPIENLWKQIKNIIGKMCHRIRNIKQMEEALAEIWPTLGGERLTKLNESMPKRLNIYIKNRGGSIKY